MGLWVNEVVGNQMMMMMVVMMVMMGMKIVQDEKAREEETGTPEWVIGGIRDFWIFPEISIKTASLLLQRVQQGLLPSTSHSYLYVRYYPRTSVNNKGRRLRPSQLQS